MVFYFMLLSFAPTKESNPRTEEGVSLTSSRALRAKVGRKRQQFLFFTICALPFSALKNKKLFAPFSVCPLTYKNFK